MMDFILDCLKISTEVSFVMILMFFFSVILTVITLKMFKTGNKSADTEDELENLKLVDVTESYEKIKTHMQNEVLPDDELKKIAEEKKKEDKEARRQQKNQKKNTMDDSSRKDRVFVLNFEGDVKATQAKVLSEQITAVLCVAEASDEVILKLTSPGGLVSAYGYAASQLVRLRQKGIKLTVCVDQIAASGGYMMACVANRIIAAPFAIVGSIGVVSEFPNFNRLLKKFDVDYEQETAGEYKRTLSMFGDNSDPKAREKFREELEECHELFKKHVSRYRQQLDISKVATGEHWFASDALKEHLVDEILTSDDYILSKIGKNQIFKFVEKKPKKSLLKKLVSGAYEGIVNSSRVM